MEDYKKILQNQLDIEREEALKLGFDTLNILDEGLPYTVKSGKIIDIKESVNKSVSGTLTYPPEDKFEEVQTGNLKTIIEIRNETTLSSYQYLVSKGYKTAILNMASATSPGGGFLHGSRAQEEYLARSSSLYYCLQNNPMYDFHRSKNDPFYSDYVIYSPDVVVIRNDYGELLENPYTCSIITSPAVQANAIRDYLPERLKEISEIMWKRILKIFAVAKIHQHEALVLGAWGCGAFGNDGNLIAALFRKALDNNFRGAFKYLTFAIVDWSDDEKFIGPFMKNFRDFNSDPPPTSAS